MQVLQHNNPFLNSLNRSQWHIAACVTSPSNTRYWLQPEQAESSNRPLVILVACSMERTNISCNFCCSHTLQWQFVHCYCLLHQWQSMFPNLFRAVYKAFVDARILIRTTRYWYQTVTKHKWQSRYHLTVSQYLGYSCVRWSILTRFCSQQSLLRVNTPFLTSAGGDPHTQGSNSLVPISFSLVKFLTAR